MENEEMMKKFGDSLINNLKELPEEDKKNLLTNPEKAVDVMFNTLVNFMYDNYPKEIAEKAINKTIDRFEDLKKGNDTETE